MRFMMLVKHAEKQGPPPKEFMDAMAIIHEEAVKAGTIRGNGGLAPTAQSTSVRLSGGRIKVIDGPFTEAKEVVGGYAEFELKSKEEAIEGRCASWNFTRNTGRDGRARPRFGRSSGRRTSRNSQMSVRV